MKAITRRARASAPRMHHLTKATQLDAIPAARHRQAIPLRGDSRLIAAVQRAARAMAHESARLLPPYSLGAALYHRTTAAADAPGLDEARREVRTARLRLREFLTEALGETPEPSSEAVA